MAYAKGKHAYGICDRTGFRYPLKDLRNQVKDQKRTGLLVGKDVLDKDQPQLQLGRIRTNESQSLRHPRPQTDLAESRRYFAFNPIGGGVTEFGSSTMGLDMEGNIGTIKITTS
tara:strand:- start:1328 stop:1669 length:342 start_codon:yes stop_codon:yes gene_type:complete